MEPQIDAVAPESVEAESPVSVMDHARQFGPNAEPSEPEAPAEASAEDLKPLRPVDQQRRDQGKFAEGKKPMRAKDAVSRINELTGRAKSAEEKLVAAEAELTRLRSERAAPAQITRAEQRVDAAEAKVEQAAPSDPEPVETDPKYADDYGKFLRDVAKWEGREAYRQERAAERQQAQRAQQDEQRRTAMTSWAGRVTSAKEKYPDFEDVALKQPAPWLQPDGTAYPQAAALDAFIMEDEVGPDVLYYFQSHRQELDALLAKPVFQQVRDLALLSQRLASSGRESSGVTGSLPKPKAVVLAPTPPNPVRTEPQRTSGPVPLDGSLSVTAHAKQFQRRH